MNQFYPCQPNPSSFISLVFLLLLSWGARAQHGSIQGHVTTSDGKPAGYVSVALKELNKGTSTAEDGSYIIRNVKEGMYTVVTSFVGLKTQEQPITVKAGQVSDLNFTIPESAQQLSEVVITGAQSVNERPVSMGKIAIRPMDLPQSITVINRETMEQQQVLRMSDVLRNTNGVYVMGTTGGTQEEIAARGFAFGSSNTFKNGVRFNNGVMPETSSLERVEVLKGSSAILFGNVAAGGVLNLVTKKPKFENGGEVSFRTGSYDFYKPSLDIYGAVDNSAHVAYRINTSYENAGSFRNEVKSERFYVNPSLLIKLGKKTDVLVEGDYLKDNRTPDYGIGAINYAISNLPRNRFLGVSWANYQVEQKSVTTTITHRLNADWQFRAVGGLQNYGSSQYSTTRPNAFQQGDSTKLYRSLQRTQADEKYYLAQLDLTGQFKTGFLKHNLLVGADADQYRTETPTFSIFADPRNPSKVSTAYDTINVFNLGESNQRSDIPQASQATLTKNVIGRGGVYVQDLLTITEKVKLLAGIRYSYMETSSEIYTYKTGQTVYTDTRFDDAFTPRVGLVYQPLKTTSVFASYANSFSLNTGIGSRGEALPPSLINQYELGVKNDLFKGLLSANLTLYQIVNSNLAQTIPQDSPNFNSALPTAQEMAGEVTSKGVELDLMTKTFRGFSFIGGYSYNQTKYTKSNTYEVGSRLRYNPTHTANASVYYAFNQRTLLKGFQVGLTGLYVGDMMAGRSTTAVRPDYRLIPLPSFFQFDASVGYTINKLSVRLRATNLLNTLGYYAHDDNSINPIAPRQFAATFSYKL